MVVRVSVLHKHKYYIGLLYVTRIVPAVIFLELFRSLMNWMVRLSRHRSRHDSAASWGRVCVFQVSWAHHETFKIITFITNRMRSLVIRRRRCSACVPGGEGGGCRDLMRWQPYPASRKCCCGRRTCLLVSGPIPWGCWGECRCDMHCMLSLVYACIREV